MHVVELANTTNNERSSEWDGITGRVKHLLREEMASAKEEMTTSTKEQLDKTKELDAKLDKVG